jgi:hypothetical protein
VPAPRLPRRRRRLACWSVRSGMVWLMPRSA